MKKDLIIKNNKIFLTNNERQKLNFKIERILKRIPKNFPSHDFSLQEYKVQVENKLEELKKEYPNFDFDTDELITKLITNLEKNKKKRTLKYA